MAEPNSEGGLSFDPHQVDQQYESFPRFEEWTEAVFRLSRWDRYLTEIEQLKDSSPEKLRKAQDIVKRAAAIDTGAIEGLYEVDRGFTFTVATEAAMWQAALGNRPDEERNLIQSQIQAYDYVLDFATERREIAEAWIRELHETICGSQRTYQVYTEQGLQKQPLKHGEYKTHPNHVRTAGGEIHAYAPVDLTPEEMHRFCEELRSDAFARAHPVLQASYAHYSLVVIHPFADGNGRVARALASVYTYRAASIPLFILAEHTEEYLRTLEAADEGNHQPFIEFVGTRSLDGMKLVQESLRAAEAPTPDRMLDGIVRLYTTRGGYTHSEVDRAGRVLQKAAAEVIKTKLDEFAQQVDAVTGAVSLAGGNYEASEDAYRQPINPSGRILNIQLKSAAPGNADMTRGFRAEVPKDAGREDDVRLVHPSLPEQAFSARVDEILPEPSGSLEMRLRIWADRILGEMLAELRDRARKQMEEEGYQ